MSIQCEVCGSSDIVKHNGLFTCQSCGMKYSLDEIRNMLTSGKQDTPQVTVSAKATVKDTVQSELQNLYVLARRARREENSENAEKYYSMILIKDPTSWEAVFYSAYFKASHCRVMDIGSAINSLSNSTPSVFNLIGEHVTSPSERKTCYEDVSSKVIDLSMLMYRTKKKRYEEITGDIDKDSLISVLTGTTTLTGSLYDMSNKKDAQKEFQTVAELISCGLC